MARRKIDPLLGPQNEGQWQSMVDELAELLGWKHYHTHDSRRSDPGFPDFVGVRERIVFAELKMPRRYLDPDQKKWRDAIRSAGGEWYLWRPDDWFEVQEVLRRRV